MEARVINIAKVPETNRGLNKGNISEQFRCLGARGETVSQTKGLAGCQKENIVTIHGCQERATE